DAVRREWAEGFVAEELDRFVREPQRDSSGETHAGVLRASDLSGWRASFEEPLRGHFRGHEIVKAGSWTQGPTLVQALGILEGFDDEQLDPSTAPGAHTMLEAMKLAMADREAHYADGADLAPLLTAEYAESRRALISTYANSELRPGEV